MDLDKSNPSNLNLDLILSLDWILDSKYFMDLDMDLDLKVPWIWIRTWIQLCKLDLDLDLDLKVPWIWTWTWIQ